MNLLRRHAILKQHFKAHGAKRKLHSAYYDTPDLELHRIGMALRIRRDGKRWIQTLKGGGSVHAGLHVRNEWETMVPVARLDFERLVECGAPRFPPKLRSRLQRIFSTDFVRTTYDLTYEGSEIELCMDVGEISSGDASCPISEIELELKSGESVQLFNFALALIDVVPLEIEVTSKAAYGYLLFTKTRLEVTKAGEISFGTDSNIASAFRNIVWSCLHQLQSNIDGAIAQEDDEFLHQLRVGMRRLRVALSIVDETFHDEELPLLLERIASLSVELGRLREWDVFIKQIAEPIAEHLSDKEIADFMNAVEPQRKKHQMSVRRLLKSQALQKTLLRFGVWTHGDTWQQTNADDQSLKQFVERMLGQRVRKVLKRGKDVATATPRELHRLRIACKKLRYGLELFYPLLRSNEAEEYLKHLNKLQESLGTLNDLVAGFALLDELDREWANQSINKIYTLMIRRWFKQQHEKQMGKLAKVWATYSRHQEQVSSLIR